jgi:hypothetical protein
MPLFLDGKHTGERLECDGWLGAFQAEGPKSTIEVFKAGNAAGFTKDQLRRAKCRVGAVARREGFAQNGQWSWGLDAHASLRRDHSLVAQTTACHQRLHKTGRAAFGGALTARELWLGGYGFYRGLPIHCRAAARVSGPKSIGAFCPSQSMAREASSLSLVTCRAGVLPARY